MGYPYGMGYGYGGYGGYYPSTIDYGTSSSYGRRGTRSSSVNSSYYNHSASTSATPGRGTGIGGARTASPSQYYQQGWKSNPNLVRSSPSGSGSRSSFFNNSGNSNWSGGRSSSSWGNSGSSGRSSFSGGSNFSGGSGFSGGGHSGGGGGFSGGGGGGGGGGRG